MARLLLGGQARRARSLLAAAIRDGKPADEIAQRRREFEIAKAVELRDYAQAVLDRLGATDDAA